MTRATRIAALALGLALAWPALGGAQAQQAPPPPTPPPQTPPPQTGGGVDKRLLTLPPESRTCRYVHYLDAPKDGGKAERTSWGYTTGSVLRGSATLDFDGDGKPETLGVAATVVRYPSNNPLEPECWFTVALLVQSPGENASKEIYRDLWSIRFDDMGDLLAALGAANPDDYFARFAALSGRVAHRFAVVPPEAEMIDADTIRWSLRGQELDPSVADSVAAEVSSLQEVRVFSYRATWVEDRRIAGWVPSLERAVTLRLGE